LDTYSPWLADFQRRLAQHDAGVDALANDIAARTDWHVQSAVAADFPDPPDTIAGAPDVLCPRGAEGLALWFEVELPETSASETVRACRASRPTPLYRRPPRPVSPPTAMTTTPDARRC